MLSKAEAIAFAKEQFYYKLSSLPDLYLDDEDVMLTAVTKNGAALEMASNRIKAMRHIVLTAHSTALSGHVIEYASDELKDDVEFIIEAISYPRYHHYLVVKYASDRILNDKKCAIKILFIGGYSLQYFNIILRDDIDVVLAAVKQCGYALEFASSRLRNTKEVVLAAVRTNGLALQYATYKMRNNKKIVLVAVSSDGMALRYATNKLQTNYDVALAAVSNEGMALKYVCSALRSDKKIVLVAMKNGNALELVSNSLSIDKDVVIEALKNNPEVLPTIRDELYTDAIFIRQLQQLGITWYYTYVCDAILKLNLPDVIVDDVLVLVLQKLGPPFWRPYIYTGTSISLEF